MGRQSNNDPAFGVAGMEFSHPNPGVPCSVSGNDSAPNAQATPPNKINIAPGVAAGLLCEKFQPIYPPIAKAARVSGTVVLQATISKTGEVENLRVISGPAMLQQAALDAVKNWRYRPYLLNNEPVEVDTTVNVIFTLGGSSVSGSSSANDSGPQERAAPPIKIHISAGVAEGMLIQKTDPIYPPIAKAARITGTVVLSVILSKTGEVESLKVISGPAMLQQAAMDAVKIWRYRPYLLNNEPVEVDTTVNVIFTLGG
jgi:TonB family protein